MHSRRSNPGWHKAIGGEAFTTARAYWREATLKVAASNFLSHVEILFSRTHGSPNRTSSQTRTTWLRGGMYCFQVDAQCRAQCERCALARQCARSRIGHDARYVPALGVWDRRSGRSILFELCGSRISMMAR